MYSPRIPFLGLAAVWESTDVQASSAARFRVHLKPRQVLHLDCPGNVSLSLQCGDNAETLAIVASDVSD